MRSQLAARRAKDRNPAKAQEKASQPQALSGKFASAAAHTPAISSDDSNDFTTTSQPPPAAIDLALVENLVDDPDTTHDNKLARAMALYAQWRYKDTEEQALEGGALIARRKS